MSMHDTHNLGDDAVNLINERNEVRLERLNALADSLNEDPRHGRYGTLGFGALLGLGLAVAANGTITTEEKVALLALLEDTSDNSISTWIRSMVGAIEAQVICDEIVALAEDMLVPALLSSPQINNIDIEALLEGPCDMEPSLGAAERFALLATTRLQKHPAYCDALLAAIEQVGQVNGLAADTEMLGFFQDCLTPRKKVD